MKQLVHRLWQMAGKESWPVPEWLEEQMVVRTFRLFLFGVLICTGLFAASFLSDQTDLKKIRRPSYGSGILQEDLELEWKKKNGEKVKKQITVQVGEEQVTDQESAGIFGKVKEKLGTVILGKNQSADEIRYPLYLPEKLEAYPVMISWTSSDPSVIDWEGKPGKNIPEEGTVLRLTAELVLQDKTDVYVQYLRVFPPVLSDEEQLEQLLQEADEDRSDQWMKLPDHVKGDSLVWKREETQSWWGIVLPVLLLPILLLLRDRQNREEKKKAEHLQLMQDYPEIVTKLTLLLTTGVSLRKSMERVGKDYLTYKKRAGERKAYEVIVQICKEMERGLSEKDAYEQLGVRCGALPYRTLSALLVQHLQKGSRGLGRMMEEEAQKAQEIRQQQARILGEQASTKLLFPMILMLVLVFLILLVPAWFTFGL